MKDEDFGIGKFLKLFIAGSGLTGIVSFIFGIKLFIFEMKLYTQWWKFFSGEGQSQ
jgi:hypothetical protein